MLLNWTGMEPVEERIHGTMVRDSYRWLEQRSHPDTEAWVRQRQLECQDYFAGCDALPEIREKVRKLLDIEMTDQVARVGDRYFFRRRSVGQEQGSLVVLDADSIQERILVDPSDAGPFVSVGLHRVSADGSLLVYERKHGGGRGKAIHVIDVSTATPASEPLATGMACGFVFASFRQGFFYCQEGIDDREEHTVRFRSLQANFRDEVVFRVPRSRDSRLVLLGDDVHLGVVLLRRNIGSDFSCEFWIAHQQRPDLWNKILERPNGDVTPILKYGRIFAVDFRQPGNGCLTELSDTGSERSVIVPDQDTLLRQLVIVGDQIFAAVATGLGCIVRRWTLEAEPLSPIEVAPQTSVDLLPGIGGEGSVFLRTESFTQRPRILEYRIDDERLHAWPLMQSESGGHAAEVHQERFASFDDCEIPITLVAPAASCRLAEPTVVLTAYGGFGASQTARFSVLAEVLRDCGVLFALAHIRGGGEFGREWHRAAIGRSKQVSISDFLAAARWLSQNVSGRRLAIFGGSHSGLLVAAAMTQAPHLFRAVLCIAPLLDMVRYEMFGEASRWRNEYGSVADAEDFSALYAYSPYHRVAEEIDYPPILFVTGDEDQACDPAHVRKMAARLSDRMSQTHPVLVDYSDLRGHSPVMPLGVRIEALARRISFLLHELDVNPNLEVQP